MTLHFAFDPGLASLGLAVTRTRPRAGIDILAVSSMIARPLAPGEAHKARMHRRRSRYLARRKARRSALAALLRDSGLLPASRDDSLFAEDPWALRDAAKDRPVAAHALGRLIMHLHARRGAPQGVIDTAGMSTPLVGEMSCSGYRPGRGAAMLRNRAHSLVIEQCLVTRTGVLAELDTILSAQKPHHAALHDTDLADRIRAHFCDAGPSVGKAHRPRPERALDTLRRLLLAAMADLERRFGKPERVTVEAAPFGPQKPASGTSKASLAQRQARAAGGIPFCPYTGTELTKAHLSSRLTETDHIVPLSRGGRNEPSNMVVCLAGANRAKGARTPREAFSHTNGWDGMVAKSGRLPHAVASHFMAPEQDRSEAPEQDALMRRAVELCRTMIARRWPETLLCVQSANAVARLRQGLHHTTGNAVFSKDRRDNRHHGIDALLAALADSQVQIEPADVLPAALAAKVVHETRSARKGRCVDETIYGPVMVRAPDGSRRSKPGVGVHRKLLLELSRSEVRLVRDPALRHILAVQAGLSRTAPHWKKALSRITQDMGIGRVRLVRPMACARPSRDGKRLYLPSGNHHADIIAHRDGRWQACGVALADAALPGYRPVWEREHWGAKLVMRLHRGDTLELDDYDGDRCLRTVRRIGAANGYLYLAAPEEGGSLERRHGDADDPFRWELASAENLRERRALALDLSPSGEMRWRRTNIGHG